jgi:hypothetical protein
MVLKKSKELIWPIITILKKTKEIVKELTPNHWPIFACFFHKTHQFKPYKNLFINTSLIQEMYKISDYQFYFLKDVKLIQTRFQNLFILTSTTCNRLAIAMGGVLWKGGSWEIVRPTIIIQFKMENACILCNIIKKIW